MKDHLSKISVLFLLILLLSAALYRPARASDPAGSLPPSDSLTVRVGVCTTDGCDLFLEDDLRSGYLMDYLNRLSYYAKLYKGIDLSFQYVPAANMAELERMSRSGEIDLIEALLYENNNWCDTSADESFRQGCVFTGKEIGETVYSLYSSLSNTSLHLDSPGELDGVTIGVLLESAGIPVLQYYAREKGLSFRLVSYPGRDELAEALNTGSITCAVSAEGEDAIRKIVAQLGKVRLYLGSASPEGMEYVQLVNELQHYLYTYEPYYNSELTGIYLSGQDSSFQALTKQEGEYIAGHDIIRVAVCTSDRPNSYYSKADSRYMGTYIDLLRLTAGYSGLRFLYLPKKDWNACLQAVKDGSVDMVFGVYKLHQISEQWDMAFSEPFISQYITVAGESGHTPKDDDLYTIGVFRGRSIEWDAYLQEYFPGWERRLYPTEERCFRAISQGDINFALIEGNNVKSNRLYSQFQNISSIPSLSHKVDVVAGVSKSVSPQLLTVLNKSIRALSPSDIISCQIDNAVYPMNFKEFLHAYMPYIFAFSLIALAFLLFTIVFAEHRKKYAEQKAAFFSNMSHEIRTPLNGIIGMTQIAKKNVDHQERLTDCLNKIDLSCGHLLTIVNDILDLSKLEKNKMEIVHEKITLGELLHPIHAIYYNQARERGIQYDTVIANLTDENLIGDYTRITQVLMNLLSNAIKFTPAGKHVSLRVEETGRIGGHAFLHFSVTDEGVGIPSENLDKIFNAYEQQGAKTAGKYGGSGLGLPISKQLVELMGGHLSVTSTPGRGSIFSFSLTLPIAKSDPDDIPEKILTGRYALVADGDSSTRDYLCQALSSLHITAAGAGSYEEVLSCLEAEDKNYGYIFISWDTMAADAQKLVDSCRQRHVDMQYIAYSAADYTALKPELDDAGITEFVEKPLLRSGIYNSLKKIHRVKTAPSDEEEALIPSCPGKRIMIAEDNEINLEILQELLKPTGCIIESALDGKQALDQFEASEPGAYDLIFMDIQMPVMNGYDAARRIRSSARTDAKTVVIIAMTADAFAEDIARAKEAGMDLHLSKPVDVQKLYDTVAHYLTESSDTEEGTHDQECRTR